VFDSVDGGAEDEVTLSTNREIFRNIGFVPRTLADVSDRNQEVDLFGVRSRSPVIVAPMGLLGLLRPDAEIMLARAAAASGVPIVLATGSSASIERVAEAASAARRWFQLYPFRDEAINRSLLARAAREGYEALVVTTDTQIAPNRDRDRRNGFSLTSRPSLRLALDIATRPAWFWRMATTGGIPRFETLAAEMGGAPSAMETAAFFLSARDWNVTLEVLVQIRRLWRGPLLVKGLLSVDSGFRRGSDVVKALALGAKAVLLGRAMAWGVAAGGPEGALRALEIFSEEIDRVMAFVGCRSLANLNRACVRLDSERALRDSLI